MRSGQSQWITHRENRLFRGHDEFFVTNLHQRCWKLAHLLCKIREFILGRVLVFFKEEGTCVLIGHVATKYISIIRSADDEIREEDIILYSKSKILNRSMLNEDKLMIRLITNKVYSSSETKTLKKLHSFIANIEWEMPMRNEFQDFRSEREIICWWTRACSMEQQLLVSRSLLWNIRESEIIDFWSRSRNILIRRKTNPILIVFLFFIYTCFQITRRCECILPIISMKQDQNSCKR